jgi:hypothetical protein
VGIRDENQEAKRPQALHPTHQQNNNQSQRGQSETLQMQMRVWELQKLKQAKIQYFTRCGLHDDGSRRQELALLRGAFSNAFRHTATLMEIGNLLGRDHSSIVHSIKQHESRLFYTDYRRFYKIACEIKNEAELDVLEDIDITSYEREITRLNEVVSELSKYKELYLTLKKTFDEF